MREMVTKYLPAIALALFITHSPAFAQSLPPLDLHPVVPTGIKRQLAFLAALNANCTSMGDIDVRLTKKPEHGEVEIENGLGYTNYPLINQRYRCNVRLVPGVRISYTSTDGFTGKDRFSIEVFEPGGVEITGKYIVTVK